MTKGQPTGFHDLRAACVRLNLPVSVNPVDEIFARALREPESNDSTKWSDYLQEEAPRLADTLRGELKSKLFIAISEEVSIGLFENPRPFDSDKVSVND